MSSTARNNPGIELGRISSPQKIQPTRVWHEQSLFNLRWRMNHAWCTVLNLLKKVNRLVFPPLRMMRKTPVKWPVLSAPTKMMPFWKFRAGSKWRFPKRAAWTWTWMVRSFWTSDSLMATMMISGEPAMQSNIQIPGFKGPLPTNSLMWLYLRFHQLFIKHPMRPYKKNTTTGKTSWWLNQPIWQILVEMGSSSSSFGGKNIYNIV